MLTGDELDQSCDILLEHEGLIPWLYCDSKGFVTVGVGDKVSPQSVLTLPFVHLADNRPATTEEKATAFTRVQDFFCKRLTASAYCAVSDLRLPVDFCRRRLAYRLKSEFVPAIEKLCLQFASFPLHAKLVLIDICYNVGTASFASFVELIADCNLLQFANASNEVHTQKEGEDPSDTKTWGRRNTWRRKTMLVAAKEIYR
jgi:GH24 family phage-related lysozyme (muramidase)